jgi:hypothetical protein
MVKKKIDIPDIPKMHIVFGEFSSEWYCVNKKYSNAAISILNYFFLKQTGELHIIILRRLKGARAHTTHISDRPDSSRYISTH